MRNSAFHDVYIDSLTRSVAELWSKLPRATTRAIAGFTVLVHQRNLQAADFLSLLYSLIVRKLSRGPGGAQQTKMDTRLPLVKLEMVRRGFNEIFLKSRNHSFNDGKECIG